MITFEKAHINSDVALEYLPSGASPLYPKKLNAFSSHGEAGDIHTVKGNTEIAYDFTSIVETPLLANFKVIGSCKYQKENAIIYFVCNYGEVTEEEEQKCDFIMKYTPSTGVFEQVIGAFPKIEDYEEESNVDILVGSILGFDEADEVDAVVIDDMLMWVVKGNEPNCIDIVKALNMYVDLLPQYEFILLETIKLIKKPPSKPIRINLTKDTDKPNVLKHQIPQFCYRYIHENNMRSVWSPTSVCGVDVEIDTDMNVVDLLLYTTATAEKIEIAVRKNYLEDWYIFKTVDLSKMSLNNEELTVQYYGDELLISIDQGEIRRQQDWVFSCNSLDVISTKSVVTGGIEEDYDMPEISIDLIPTFKEIELENSINKIPVTRYSNTDKRWSFIRIGESFFGFGGWIIERRYEFYITLPPTCPTEDIFVAVTVGVNTYSDSVTLLPATYPTGAVTAIKDALIDKGFDADLFLDITYNDYKIGIRQLYQKYFNRNGKKQPIYPNTEIEEIIGATSVIIYEKKAKSKSYSSFKMGVSHPVALRYRDEYGRKCAVVPAGNCYIPFVTEVGGDKLTIKNGIRLDIWNYAPTWATQCEILIAKSKISWFKQYIVSAITSNELEIKNPISETQETYDNSEVIETYQFQKGDRVRILTEEAGEEGMGDVYGTYVDAEIISYKSDEGSVTGDIVLEVDTNLLSDVGLGSVVEIYRLSQEVSEQDQVYYEIGATIDILEDNLHSGIFYGIGDELDYNSGLLQQVVSEYDIGSIYVEDDVTKIKIYDATFISYYEADDNADYIKQLLINGTENELFDGNVFGISNYIKDTDDGGEYASFELSPNYYIEEAITDGTVSVIVVPAKVMLYNGDVWVKSRTMVFNGTTYTYACEDSNRVEQYGSATNNFGRPDVPDPLRKQVYYPERLRKGGIYFENTSINNLNRFEGNDFIDLDSTNGDINYLMSRGKTLKVFQDKKVNSQYIGVTETYDEGGEQRYIGMQNKVFGSLFIPEDFYGTTIKPVKSAKDFYYIDLNNNAVRRDSTNGAITISDNGMSEYFKNAIDTYKAYDGDKKILLGFDNYHKKLFVTIQHWFTETSVYDEDTNTWETFMSHAEELQHNVTSIRQYNGYALLVVSGYNLTSLSSKGVFLFYTRNSKYEGRIFEIDTITYSSTPKLTTIKILTPEITTAGSLVTYKNNLAQVVLVTNNIEYYESINKEFLSFMNGQVWRHNTNSVGLYYGMLRPILVPVVFNELPATIKNFINVWLHSNYAMFIPYIHIQPNQSYTRGMVSELTAGNFDLEDGIYKGLLKYNGYTTTDYYSWDDLVDGEELKGRIMLLYLYQPIQHALFKLFGIEVNYLK